VLKTGFGQLKGGVEQFAGAVLKAHTTLKEGLGESVTMSTLSTALRCLTQSLREMGQQYSSFASALQGNVIEPIDLFHEHLRTSNSKETGRGLQLINDLQRAKESLRRIQHKYYKRMSDADEAEAHFDRLPFKDRALQIQKVTHLKLKAAKANEQYKATFKAVQSMWAEYDLLIPRLLFTLQENEESRIHFLKTTLDKLASQYIRVMESVTTSLKDLSAVVGNVSGNIDVRVLVNSLDGKHVQVARDLFVTYEDWRAKCAEHLREDDFILLDDEVDGPEQESSYVRRVVEGVFSNSAVDCSKVLLSSSSVRDLLIALLEERKSECSPAVLSGLAGLYNRLLSSLDESPSVFYKAVQLSEGFYCTSLDGRRKYLSTLVSPHSIWSDTQRWQHCIDMLIAQKVQTDHQFLQQRQQSKGFMSAIKSFANKLPLFKGNEIRPEKSVAFMVISQFNFYMINLGLPLETICDIVLKTCMRVHLDAERTCILLAELQANQRGNKANSKDSKSSVRRRKKAYLKWGPFLPVSLASEYLDCNDLKTMVLVCKDWRTKLIKVTQWKSLQTAVPYSVNHVGARRQFWISQSQPSLKTLNYFAVARDSEANASSIHKLGEIIVLDMKRCFHNTSGLNHQSVTNVLRAYAFYDQEVGYCQGMNYIAGVLYLQLQDEDCTFRALVGMIEKYRMASLYHRNLPRLKLLLYQLDRLIGIFLPELHRVFKEEMVASSHFASSWFITLFAATLSSTPQQLTILFQIWDMFFLEGWRAVFKCALAVLMRLSEVLAAGKLEQVMSVLSKIGSPLCAVQIFDEEFIPKMQSVCISNALLRDLESEYEHLKLRASVLPL
jgi:hypothetical protein